MSKKNKDLLYVYLQRLNGGKLKEGEKNNNNADKNSTNQQDSNPS